MKILLLVCLLLATSAQAASRVVKVVNDVAVDARLNTETTPQQGEEWLTNRWIQVGSTRITNVWRKASGVIYTAAEKQSQVTQKEIMLALTPAERDALWNIVVVDPLTVPQPPAARKKAVRDFFLLMFCVPIIESEDQITKSVFGALITNSVTTLERVRELLGDDAWNP